MGGRVEFGTAGRGSSGQDLGDLGSRGQRQRQKSSWAQTAIVWFPSFPRCETDEARRQRFHHKPVFHPTARIGDRLTHALNRHRHHVHTLASKQATRVTCNSRVCWARNASNSQKEGCHTECSVVASALTIGRARSNP